MRITPLVEKSFFSLDALDTLSYAAKKMAERNLSDVPVLQQGRLAGILTTSDIASALVKRSIMGRPQEADSVKVGGMPIGRHMARKIVCLKEDAELLDAMQLFSAYNIGCIPVVDRKGKAVGAVFAEDVRKKMAEMLSDADEKGVKKLGKSAAARAEAAGPIERQDKGNTAIDQILKYVERKGAANSSEIARQFSLPVSEVEEYAVSLEKHALLEIEYNIFGRMKLKRK